MTDDRRHREISNLLGAYALGAVEATQRRRIEAHLETCAACREELSQLREAADALPSPPQPSDELWQRIVAARRAAEGDDGQQGDEGDPEPDENH